MSPVARGVHMAIRRRMMHADVDVVDEGNTTFVSANYTPTADGTTATTLTFTAKDSGDNPLEGVSVTYA